MRSFVAVELGEAVRASAEAVVGSLAKSLHGVRWVSGRLMHVTVRFLGEIDDGAIAGIREAIAAEVSNLAPFEASLDRVGWFPPRGKARVIWLGFGAGHDELVVLGRKVDDALARRGLPPENRPFTPHVTIGRARRAPISTQPLSELSCDEAAVDQSAMMVEAVTLFESRLSSSGPRYHRLGRFALAAESDDSCDS